MVSASPSQYVTGGTDSPHALIHLGKPNAAISSNELTADIPAEKGSNEQYLTTSRKRRTRFLHRKLRDTLLSLQLIKLAPSLLYRGFITMIANTFSYRLAALSDGASSKVQIIASRNLDAICD